MASPGMVGSPPAAKDGPSGAALQAVSAHAVERSPPSTSSEQEAPVCWICLDYSTPLIYPCKCPRTAHPRCLARWQLQSAGSRRETHCEFCDAALPDWKAALTPDCGARAPAVMNVNFDGRTYSFEVRPGPDGYRLFTESIRRAFSLPADAELNITFTCDEPAPDMGSLLTLQGSGAYDAAVHCASVSAARRLSGSAGPSRSASATSGAGGAGGGGGGAPPALQRLPSPGTPRGGAGGSAGGGGAPPGSPDSVSAASAASSAGDACEPGPGGKRRAGGVGGLGRKIRTAFADLMTPRGGGAGGADGGGPATEAH